jgi:hypothetical protein
MDPIPPEERYVWLFEVSVFPQHLLFSCGSLSQRSFHFAWAPARDFLTLLSELLNFVSRMPDFSQVLSDQC